MLEPTNRGISHRYILEQATVGHSAVIEEAVRIDFYNLASLSDIFAFMITIYYTAISARGLEILTWEFM